MCGIAGILGNPASRSASDLMRMLASMLHRGDSPFETLVNDVAALGTNRLRIVDPDSGRQPITTADGRFACLLNGEIYNHHELRAQLRSLGHQFITDCDTEVAMRAYIEWGTGALNRLEGMFALAVVDYCCGDLFLARDPFGQKPLFWLRVGDMVRFASELKAFEGFHNVEEFPPGHYSLGGASPQCYFSVDDVLVDIHSLDDAARSLRKGLLAAVEQQTRDLDRVALIFSGGVDSTCILECLLLLGREVVCFALGKDDAEDVVFARRVCREKGVELHHREIGDSEVRQAIPGAIRALEGWPVNLVRGGVLSYLIAAEIRATGFVVALCGEGSDELFGGYADFAGVSNSHEGNQLIRTFVRDLHRTQLRRVDRANMAFGVEVRSPFLDLQVARLALRIAFDLKVVTRSGTPPITKHVLREAFCDCLPSYIYTRPKTTFMRGAGLGDAAGEQGPFTRIACELAQSLGLASETCHTADIEARVYRMLFERNFLGLDFGRSGYTTRVDENALR